MNKIPFVDLRAQHAAIRDEILAATSEVLERADFILGRQVEEFESNFATFIGAGFAVSVNSGLDALRLALMALEIGTGDSVIVPANTFIATR